MSDAFRGRRDHVRRVTPKSRLSALTSHETTTTALPSLPKTALNSEPVTLYKSSKKLHSSPCYRGHGGSRNIIRTT